MSRHVGLAVFIAVALLLLLFALWPSPAASDVAATPSAISGFEAVGSGGGLPVTSGQTSTPSAAPLQSRTPASEALRSARSGDDPRGPGSTPGGGTTPYPSPVAVGSPSPVTPPESSVPAATPVRIPATTVRVATVTGITELPAIAGGIA